MKKETEPKERPILFLGEMVRAILDGRKTQTRPVIKPQPIDTDVIDGIFCMYDKSGKESYINNCPYGQSGDLLYVRETWRQAYPKMPWSEGIIYRADRFRALGMDEYTDRHKWKSSIFMPKKAARIWLQIKNIRVERIQDITEKDCDAEGMGFLHEYFCNSFHHPAYDFDETLSLKELMNAFWNSTNKKRGYSWESNPWVWVIEFERIDK
jgi:hypothetical protein